MLQRPPPTTRCRRARDVNSPGLDCFLLRLNPTRRDCCVVQFNPGRRGRTFRAGILNIRDQGYWVVPRPCRWTVLGASLTAKRDARWRSTEPSSFDGSAGNGHVQTLRDIMSSISIQQAGGPHQFARIFLYGNVIFNRRCAARCLLAQIMTARRTTSPTSFPNPCS